MAAEVLVALWRRPEAFDPARGSLVGYLRMKARSTSIDRLRSDQRRVAREQREACEPQVGAREVEDQVVDAASADELWRGVARLPVGERRAIELAFQRGMTYQAVAERLGVPEGTVKTRIRSGLRRLRASIHPEQADLPALGDPGLGDRTVSAERRAPAPRPP